MFSGKEECPSHQLSKKTCPRNCWSSEAWFAAHDNPIAIFGRANITINTLFYDLMHTKYLGVDSYVVGSILVFLVDHKNTNQGSAQDRLDAIWEAIKEGYHNNHSSCRFTGLTLNMIRASKGVPFAHLKGKAAEVKALVPVLHEIAQHFLDATKREEHLMIEALGQSSLIDQIILHNKHLPCLPENQKNMLVRAASAYNQIIAALGDIFHPRGDKGRVCVCVC